MQGDEEVIELRQGMKVIPTANTGHDGFYKVAIKPLESSPNRGKEMCAWPRGGGGRPHAGAQPGVRGISGCKCRKV